MASPLNLGPGGPRPRHRAALALCLAVVATPAAAQIAPLTAQSVFYARSGNTYSDTLAVDGGFIWTDNVTRSAGGGNQTLLLLGLSGATSRDGPRLDWHLSSNAALVKYFGGAYPTEPTGFLDGLAGLKIVPGLFTWIVRETFSEVQIDPYAPVTPANLVNLNFLTTGPRFTLRPTLRTSVTLDALYSYVTSSSRSATFVDIDNQRYGGNFKIDRAFSEAASVYIKAHYEKVDFKDQVDNNNYSIAEAFAGYQLIDGRTVFDFSGGYSVLQAYNVPTIVEGPGGSRQTQENKKFQGPVWRIDVSRLITPAQRLALHASQQFTDAASAFRLGFDQPVPVIAPPILATSDAFSQRQYSIDWRFQAARTGFNLTLVDLRQHYEVNSVNDVEIRMANAALSRLLSPVLTAGLAVTFQRTEPLGSSAPAGQPPPPPVPGEPPPGPRQPSKLWGALADLRWQVGERFALRFLLAHTEQVGVYRDNQVGITGSWALLGPQAHGGQAFPGLAPLSPASTRSP